LLQPHQPLHSNTIDDLHQAEVEKQLAVESAVQNTVAAAGSAVEEAEAVAEAEIESAASHRERHGVQLVANSLRTWQHRSQAGAWRTWQRAVETARQREQIDELRKQQRQRETEVAALAVALERIESELAAMATERDVTSERNREMASRLIVAQVGVRLGSLTAHIITKRRCYCPYVIF